jgi:hypothetical protein
LADKILDEKPGRFARHLHRHMAKWQKTEGPLNGASAQRRR